MNVTFQPKEETVRQNPEFILIEGEKRGEISVYKPDSPGMAFWAAIKIKGLSPGLLQGTGDTKESAIINALDQGKDDANLQLLSIRELEKQLAV